MKIQSIINHFLKQARFKFLSPKADVPARIGFSKAMDDCSFENKNIFISGEFFPSHENALKERLQKRKAKLQPFLTRDTEILVCGKYPDWLVMEEAKRNGVKIIMVDKASDLFSRFATNIHDSNSPAPHQVPLGI